MTDDGDRIHEATPLRLQQARADGEVPKSFELAAALAMIGAIGAGYFTLNQFGSWLTTWTTNTWTTATPNQSSPEIIKQLQTLICGAIYVLLPFFVFVFLIAVCSHWLQTGPIWITKRIVPEANRVSPRRWFSQFRPGQLLSVSILGPPKIGLGIFVMGLSLWHQQTELFGLSSYPADILVQRLFGLVAAVSLHVASALLLIGVIDFGFKCWSYRRQMRMTEQEIRDERRMQDGDSVSRSRQRQLTRV